MINEQNMRSKNPCKIVMCFLSVSIYLLLILLVFPCLASHFLSSVRGLLRIPTEKNKVWWNEIARQILPDFFQVIFVDWLFFLLEFTSIPSNIASQSHRNCKFSIFRDIFSVFLVNSTVSILFSIENNAVAKSNPFLKWAQPFRTRLRLSSRFICIWHSNGGEILKSKFQSHFRVFFHVRLSREFSHQYSTHLRIATQESMVKCKKSTLNHKVYKVRAWWNWYHRIYKTFPMHLSSLFVCLPQLSI